MALIALSIFFASIGGFCLWQSFEKWRRSRRHKESLKGSQSGNRVDALVIDGQSKMSPNDRMVAYLCTLSRNISLANQFAFIRKDLAKPKWFERNIRYTGLEGRISAHAFVEARFRIAMLGAGIGLVIGLIFSLQMGLVLALVAGILGWQMPQRALLSRIDMRAHESERHLPEMLDVVALGMRSGLSFDSSLALYSEHFDTELSRELAVAQRQWRSGLKRRDEALRELAQTYKSVVFGRVVETIVRSIRYGSSMVKSLEEDAADARDAYQSERQERIAKAPVKMMIPTGVLILPAMLIMVLGPVLLELAGGGL